MDIFFLALLGYSLANLPHNLTDLCARYSLSYPRFKANMDLKPMVLPPSPNCYESLTHAKNRLERERQEMAGGRDQPSSGRRKKEIQGSAQRLAPGCVSAAGKARQKW